jgi:hypothetical protein
MYTIVPTMTNHPDGMCQMGTAALYARPVARKRYAPPSPDVAERIDEVVRLYGLKLEYEERYKAALAAVADKSGDAVPVAHLADCLGVERKTIYRHLGRSMT